MDTLKPREPTLYEREINTPYSKLMEPRPCMNCGKPFTGIALRCASCHHAIFGDRP